MPPRKTQLGNEPPKASEAENNAVEEVVVEEVSITEEAEVSQDKDNVTVESAEDQTAQNEPKAEESVTERVENAEDEVEEKIASSVFGAELDEISSENKEDYINGKDESFDDEYFSDSDDENIIADDNSEETQSENEPEIPVANDTFDDTDESQQQEDFLVQNPPERRKRKENDTESPDETNRVKANSNSSGQRLKRSKVLNEKAIFSTDYEHGLSQKTRILYRAKNTNRVLKAKVIKTVTLRKNSETDFENVFAGCKVDGFEEFEFFVPFRYLDPFEAGNQVSYSRASKDMKVDYVRSIIHAEINICLEAISTVDMRVLCDRAKANKILREKYYYKGFTLQNSPSIKRLIKSGTKINGAQIISSSMRHVVAEVYGAQFMIPIEEISHNFIRTAYDLSSGDTVPVVLKTVEQINSLKNDESNEPSYAVKIEASIKDRLEDIPRTKLRRAKVGEVISGKVTLINADRSPMGVTDDGYNFITSIVKSRITNIRPGSEVTVRVIKKYENEKTSYAFVDLLDVTKI